MHLICWVRIRAWKPCSVTPYARRWNCWRWRQPKRILWFRWMVLLFLHWWFRARLFFHRHPNFWFRRVRLWLLPPRLSCLHCFLLRRNVSAKCRRRGHGWRILSAAVLSCGIWKPASAVPKRAFLAAANPIFWFMKTVWNCKKINIGKWCRRLWATVNKSMKRWATIFIGLVCWRTNSSNTSICLTRYSAGACWLRWRHLSVWKHCRHCWYRRPTMRQSCVLWESICLTVCTSLPPYNSFRTAICWLRKTNPTMRSVLSALIKPAGLWKTRHWIRAWLPVSNAVSATWRLWRATMKALSTRWLHIRAPVKATVRPTANTWCALKSKTAMCWGWPATTI